MQGVDEEGGVDFSFVYLLTNLIPLESANQLRNLLAEDLTNHIPHGGRQDGHVVPLLQPPVLLGGVPARHLVLDDQLGVLKPHPTVGLASAQMLLGHLKNNDDVTTMTIVTFSK